MFLTPNGIEFFNPQTLQLSNPENRHVIAPQDVTAIPSPDGTRLAYLTGQAGIQNLSLIILSVSEQEPESFALLDPRFQPGQDAQSGDPLAEAARTLIEVTNFSWSPAGDGIAATGLLSGPTANLYWIPAEDSAAEPHQLTFHDDHVIRPSFSPNGRYIVYLTVNSLGKGDGYDLAGFWVLDRETGQTRPLGSDPGLGDETIAGWLDATTLLVHSRREGCGPSNLRAVNILDGRVKTVLSSSFNGVAFDGDSRRTLVSIDQFTAACGGGEPGLFLLHLDGQGNVLETDRLVPDESFLPVYDRSADLFLARTPDSVLALLTDDRLVVLQAPEPFLPVASSEGMLAWASPISGVWVGSLEGAPKQISTNPAGVPAWSPDGRQLYYLDEDGLWFASVPDFDPVLVAPGLFSSVAFWLAPP